MTHSILFYFHHVVQKLEKMPRYSPFLTVSAPWFDIFTKFYFTVPMASVFRKIFRKNPHSIQYLTISVKIYAPITFLAPCNSDIKFPSDTTPFVDVASPWADKLVWKNDKVYPLGGHRRPLGWHNHHLSFYWILNKYLIKNRYPLLLTIYTP